MRLENGQIWSRFPTRLATIAQVRQAAREALNNSIFYGQTPGFWVL